MKVVESPVDLQRILEDLRSGQSDRTLKVGFVPTLGALHSGHQSLVDKARSQCDVVVTSIFVNPKQFGPNEDLARYPRTLGADCALLESVKCDVVFVPAVQDVYPADFRTSVHIGGGLTEVLCGRSRPGHFNGVATVLARLFGWVGPCQAYFGLKDLQQCLVVRSLVRDLALSVGLCFEPTVRDVDGLALSSRNRYLSTDERKRALALPQGLRDLESWLKDHGFLGGDAHDGRPHFGASQTDFAEFEQRLALYRERLNVAGFEIDYVEARTLPDLGVVRNLQSNPNFAIFVAAKMGQTRLIDNVIIGSI